MKFWNFKNKDGAGELTLYGEIASSTWWGDELTPKQFKDDLDSLGDIKNLNIYINSGGGDVFAGQAIHSMLKRHPANKTVYIDGLAASIASVIAMAGDKIIMPKNAMMMIHNAWTFAAGNKDDLRKMADDMEKIDASIVSTYAEKTGKSDKEITALMDAETWFTADEAVKEGFADELEAEKKIAASIAPEMLDRYKNPPRNLKDELGLTDEEPTLTDRIKELEAKLPEQGGFFSAEQQGKEPVADMEAQKRRFDITNKKFKITEE